MALDKVKSKAELKQLQKVFAKIIRRPLKGGDKMQQSNEANEMILPSDALSPNERLELYAQQYWWRIRESLAEDFPTVRKVLGEKLFKKVSEIYLTKFPSRSFTLRNLGSRFPKFLLSAKQIPAARRTLAAEVASLEWDKIEVFDAASAKAVDAKLSGSVKLVLSPALRIRKLRYPAHLLFRGAQSASPHEQTSNVQLTTRRNARKKRTTSEIALKLKTTFIATHRYRGELFFKELSADEFSLLTLVGKSKTLSLALRQWRPKDISAAEIETAVAGFFREWGSLGWLSVVSQSAR